MNFTETDRLKKDAASRKFGAITGLCFAPIVFLSAISGHAGRGLAAAVFSGALLLAVRGRWELRNRVWFRVVVVSMVVLHLSLVIFIPWPNEFYAGMAIALLPVMALDYAVVYGCIRLLEKVMSVEE